MAKLKNGTLATKKKTIASYARTGVTNAEFAKLNGLTATTTELNYLDGVTSAIQGQLGTGPGWSDNMVYAKGPVNFGTQSTTYVDIPGASVTITPTSVKSRIVFMHRFSPHVNAHNGPHHRTAQMHLYRGNYDTGMFQAQRQQMTGTTGVYDEKSTTLMKIDHPNTTSAVTYKLMGKQAQTYQGCEAYFNHGLVGNMEIETWCWEVNTGNNQSFNWSA